MQALERLTVVRNTLGLPDNGGVAVNLRRAFGELTREERTELRRVIDPEHPRVADDIELELITVGRAFMVIARITIQGWCEGEESLPYAWLDQWPRKIGDQRSFETIRGWPTTVGFQVNAVLATECLDDRSDAVQSLAGLLTFLDVHPLRMPRFTSNDTCLTWF